MNFKQFLIEGGEVGGRMGRRASKRSKPTSMLEAIDFIQTNCSEILNVYKTSDSRIYRGIPMSGDKKQFLYADSTIKKRLSQNTRNYYTLVMDNSKNWKDFPKRSESFICATTKSRADSYGKVYLVFPVDGTKIAVCPDSDMWFSGRDGSNLSDFNDDIDNIADEFEMRLDETNYEKFKKQLGELSVKLRKSGYDRIYIDDYVERVLKKHNSDLYASFEYMLDPTAFHLYTTKNYAPKLGKECWFSGQAIFVAAEDYLDVGTKNMKNYKKMSKEDKETYFYTLEHFFKDLM
jgi:hypothetical protein